MKADRNKGAQCDGRKREIHTVFLNECQFIAQVWVVCIINYKKLLESNCTYGVVSIFLVLDVLSIMLNKLLCFSSKAIFHLF